uniref:Transposon protein, putative, unclassified n=1 Tax=Oryza sativa subsp. japonica TaxID=39947 RepID=Q337Q9_ORYSJ|nr:transposon protein, putative, unclassified [Oryza sativa Japonica Group]
MSGFKGFTNPFPMFSTNNGVCGIFGIRAQRARIPRDAAGPRAAGWRTVDRAREGGGGRRRLTGSARSKPRWRRRGAYVAATRAGRRRKKGRPRWSADGGSFTGTACDGEGDGEHIGTTRRTRESEPTAQIRWRVAGDGESRRRQPAASKGGNDDETTRVQFKGVGASPGLKGFVSGIGWGGEALWRSSDVRRPPGAGSDGGKAMASGGGAWGGAYEPPEG